MILVSLIATLAMPAESMAGTSQEWAGFVILMKNYYNTPEGWSSKEAPNPNPLVRQQTAGQPCDGADQSDDGWTMCRDADVYWGDRLTLERNARLRLEVGGGVIVLLPEVRDEEGGQAWGETATDGLYILRQENGAPVVEIQRGVVIAKDWEGSQESSFRMVASGMNADVTGTSWFLAVGADSVAELVVDRGGTIVLTDANAYGAEGAGSIIARPERMYRWKDGELLAAVPPPPGVDPFEPEETQYWSDIISYNADDFWDSGGGFPWIVVVPAVAVPIVLCAILCGGDDDGGKTGTVTIPIP